MTVNDRPTSVACTCVRQHFSLFFAPTVNNKLIITLSLLNTEQPMAGGKLFLIKFPAKTKKFQSTSITVTKMV
jgi:hypothetical protein